MSEWKKVKLGEISQTIQTGPFGSQLHQSDYSVIGIPVVMPKDIIAGNIEEASIARVEQHHIDRLSRHMISYGDILYARRGDVGKCAFTKQNQEGWLCGTGCLRVTINPDMANPKFVFFQLQKQETIGWITNHAIGSTMLNLNTTILSNAPVEIPSLRIQNRIVEILSRYDSLIENYQKQIKLLEEAAQRLYKEWFVGLRFPGHENTNIIDGVPEGWEKKSVDSIYNIKYGKNLSTKLITETGFYPVYGANGVIGYYDKANCNEQVVLITSRGNGSGDVLMTYHKDAFITNNSFIVTPSEGFEYCKLPFTFQFLKMANFRAVRTGAAQPQLTNQSIHTVDVILPNKNLIEKFCSATIGMNDTIIKYREQIRLLTEARDRLLPKLMSGELTLEARAEKEDLLATPCKRGWEEDEAK